MIDVTTIKIIPLTKNQVALIDIEDAPLIEQYSWCAMSGGAQARLDTNTRILMHRLILNPPDNMEVDHINRHHFDNRRCNLRLATRAQNSRNRKQHRTKQNNSPYKGVTDRPSKAKGGYRDGMRPKRFSASLFFQGVRYSLGAYPTAELAARAYDVQAKALFGEFAALNFPDDDNEAILTEYFQKWEDQLKIAHQTSLKLNKLKRLNGFTIISQPKTRAARREATRAYLAAKMNA